jgi:hypothetical protein
VRPPLAAPFLERSQATSLSPVTITLAAVALPASGTLTGAIRGDEIRREDVLFGGLCTHTPCKVMEFGEFSGNPRQVELRLRWNDPARQLALYKFAGVPDVRVQVQSAERYAGPSDSQQFALTVRQTK